MWVITTIGILGAVSLIVFNVLNHHRRYYFPNESQFFNFCVFNIDYYYSLFLLTTFQGYCSIISGLQYNNVVRLCIELEQYLFIWLRWSNYITVGFSKHMPNKNLGVVNWIYSWLWSYV